MKRYLLLGLVALTACAKEPGNGPADGATFTDLSLTDARRGDGARRDASLRDGGFVPYAPPGTPAPGTTLPSSTSGSDGLRMTTSSGLYYLDLPAKGEPSVVGYVIVAGTQGPLPADLEVTLNDVKLVHLLSANYYEVDPKGPQPRLGPDGFLRIVASSASTGLTRTTLLACPPAVVATSRPAGGTSLAGHSNLSLGWQGALPENPASAAAYGLKPPTASLFGHDVGANTLTNPLDTRPVDPALPVVVLTVRPVASAGYLAELRYPGVLLMDGQSGGVCGRVVRIPFLK